MPLLRLHAPFKESTDEAELNGPQSPWGPPQEQVLSSITHDLRAPLSAIMGYLDLVCLQVGESAPPKTVEYLSLAREAGRRMGQMVNDMLDMFQLENNQHPLKMSSVPVKGLLQNVHTTFAGVSELKKIRFTCHFPQTPLSVWGDPRYLGRVLDNLTANAIKFTPPGGEIHIRVQRDANRTSFEVTDTGRGIPTEDQKRIFDRFQQILCLDSQKGYGMGLAVVKTIVKAHGGGIQLDSRPGQGSRFIFWIPEA